MLGIVVATRVFSRTPYRLRFRSPFFRRAFRFSYPLMFNGFGLAISAQGDRFLVGAMLDLPSLGVYTVLTLVTVVPIVVVSRIINTVLVAALFNAAEEVRRFDARLRLASRATPIIGASLAVGVLMLMNIVVPVVFGHKFIASQWMVILLALGVFVRVARVDPGTALLLVEGRTKRLALVNLAVISGIFFSGALMFFFRNFESAALGRVLGELAGLTIMRLAHAVRRGAAADNLVALGICAAIVSFASGITFFMPSGGGLVSKLTLLCLFLAGMAMWASRFALPLAKVAFPAQFPSNHGALGSADEIA